MHVMTPDDFDNKMLMELFLAADTLALGKAHRKHFGGRCDFLQGKVMATLFLEPSMRTRMSFESAMSYLGGTVTSAPVPEATSSAKGESVADTVRVASKYCDVLVVRTPCPSDQWFGYKGTSLDAMVINAGDGPCHHPTQAMLDLYTIWRHEGGQRGQLFRPRNTIGISGDLSKSRAIKSFYDLMKRERTTKFIAYDATGKQSFLDPLEKYGSYLSLAPIIHCKTPAEFEEKLGEMDVIYLNRVQNERHEGDTFILDTYPFILQPHHIPKLKERAIVLNPGPRKEELPPPMDNYHQVKFWPQVDNGLHVRMALLRHMFANKVFFES